MNSELTDALAEQWRDALSAYVMHHVLPDELQAGALNMITADHLDRYFMLDTQVTSKVTTSYLAEALACTQTYINSIFNNLEPGYSEDFDPVLRTFWQQAMSNYSIWAAYQMLEDYPENYIRADLRLNKTTLFEELENYLGQGRITDATVQKALSIYFKSYEYQNSIRVQSGYIDYRNDNLEASRFAGYAYANSEYYLLGKDTNSPPQYYWRKVDVRLDQASTNIQPDAWTEWKQITIPSGTTVLQARLVLVSKRLHLVLLHHGAPVSLKVVEGDHEVEKERYTLKLEVIHLALDKQWTQPETLYVKEVDVWMSHSWEPDSYTLLALGVARSKVSDEQLFIALRGARGLSVSFQRDVLKRVNPTYDFTTSIQNLWFDYFNGTNEKLFLQERVDGAQWKLESVEADEGGDPDVELEFVLQQHNLDVSRLHVRARSSEVRYKSTPVFVCFRSFTLVVQGYLTQVEIISSERGDLEVRCKVSGEPDFSDLKVSHKTLPDMLLPSDQFTKTDYGWYELVKTYGPVSEANELADYDVDTIYSGGTFKFFVDNSELPSFLRNSHNYIVYVPEIVTVDGIKLEIEGADTPKWTGSFTYNGSAVSGWITHVWDHTGEAALVCRLTDASSRVSRFTVKRAANDVFGVGARPFISRQSSGTDFLVFDFIGDTEKGGLAVRLNSQQVPDLISRAGILPQKVFAWDAQHLQEPAYVKVTTSATQSTWAPSADDPLLNMYDANGMYLRELFFHVPHLIASRLQEEERFEDARRWLELIFNPQSKQSPTEKRGVDYWNCAWLTQEDTGACAPDHELIDPHVIALRNPSHYRKAVFVQYVNLLIGEADFHYRQQTRDSLATAWLLYRMAADLMGEAPDARTINTWVPRTVAELLSRWGGGERLERHADAVKPENLPKQLSTFFWAGVAVHDDFRMPANRDLLDIWDLLAQRFHNLRHFLSIEGYPMELPLYAPAANPFDLLMARMGGNANLAHLMGYRTVVPPFRFRTLVAKAQETVTALIQYGEQLRNFLELEERTELEAMQYQQAAEIAGYTIGIQEQLLSQQQKNEDVLTAQRAATALRQEHYARLYEENMSGAEIAAMTVHTGGRYMSTGINALFAGGNLASMAPNIFGMANGGQEYKGALVAAGLVMEAVAGNLVTAGEVLRETEGYRRRRQEWQLQAKLAGKELEVIDKQLEAQKHMTLAAQASLEHSRKALAQSQQLYAYYQNKSTSVSLYRWLRSQATTWHATLFDVAVSLCNSAQACWQFETGNYDRQIIRTPIWQADRYGLNAGGELRLDLHRLETEFLLRHERHLELRKTVSLQALVGEKLVSKPGDEPLESWEDVLRALTDGGELAFSLSEMLYDQDYPGHYLRRLHSVALTLPALLGPYQNIRATLTQTQSRLVTTPELDAVLFLTPELYEDVGPGDGRYVMMSLRPRQQVCLSSASQDIGLVGATETDDRYLPFEGTGAVSDWHLKFPRHKAQAELINSLSDIILEVRYLALHGGAGFDAEVEELVEKYLRPAP